VGAGGGSAVSDEPVLPNTTGAAGAGAATTTGAFALSGSGWATSAARVRWRALHMTPNTAGGTPMIAPRPSVTTARRTTGWIHAKADELRFESGNDRGGSVGFESRGTPIGLVSVVRFRTSSGGGTRSVRSFWPDERGGNASRDSSDSSTV